MKDYLKNIHSLHEYKDLIDNSKIKILEKKVVDITILDVITQELAILRSYQK